MLPPHRAWVIEANPAIIPASKTSGILYFGNFFNINLMLNTFNNTILSNKRLDFIS